MTKKKVAAKPVKKVAKPVATKRADMGTEFLKWAPGVKHAEGFAPAPVSAVFISPVTVFEIKQMREEERALSEKLKGLSEDLKSRENAVIVALESGIQPGPGCPSILVEEKDGVCRPKWKDECLTLAEKTGLNKLVFEAEVKARTPVPKVKTLVIGNGITVTK